MTKINVSIQNITRLHEDFLYLALDKAYDEKNHELEDMIEAELDRRHDAQEKMLKIRQINEVAALAKVHQLETEIAAIFDGYKGKKTLFLIERLGQEFIGDYIVDEDFLTIHSKVAGVHFQNQNSNWTFENVSQLRSKLAGLLYDRIYSYWMRDASERSLAELKGLLK